MEVLALALARSLAEDPDKAKQLLAEAGYPDGFGITIHSPNNRYVNDEQTAQARTHAAEAAFRLHVADEATGTVKLKALFANADGALFPNQFVNVRMHVDTLAGATVVPTPAVQRGSPGTFVYRVNDDDTVSVQPVKLGPVEGETSVVTEGLNAGDRVVVDGTDKLRDGAKIEPIDRAAAASATPRTAGADAPVRGKGQRRAGTATAQ